MALQKQLVHLNMTGGVQTKDDQFLVIPSKLAVADNVEFDDASTVVRRGGQAKLTLPAGAPYLTAKRLFRHKGSPVVEFEDGTMLRAGLSNSLPSDFGVNSGSYRASSPITQARVAASTRRLFSTESGFAEDFDIAFGPSTYCVARSGYDPVIGYFVKLTIHDNVTGVEMLTTGLAGAALSETVSQPRVIYNPDNLTFALFTYHEDSAFVTASVKQSSVLANGSAFLTAATTVFGLTPPGVYRPIMDAALSVGSGFVVCARSGGSGAITMRLLDLDYAPIIATVTGAPAGNPVSLTAHATFSAGVLTGHAIYGDGASIMGRRVNDATGIISAEATISTVVGSLVGRIAVTDTAGALNIVCDTFATTTSTNPTNYLVAATTAHVFVNRTAIATNCFLAGRIFQMRGRDYVPVILESAWFQGTLFLLDLTDARRNMTVTAPASPLFAARLDFGEVAYSGMSSTNGTARRVPSASSALTPYLKFETDVRLAGTSNVTPKCISAATFTDGQLGDAEVNGITFLAGAMPMVCDGNQIVEEGFHWGPEAGAAALTPVTTGTGVYSFPNTTGTYSVAFTEAWQDAQGNWHESAVAATHTVSITAGSGLLDINPTFVRPPSMKLGRVLLMYRTLRSSTDTSLYLAHTGDLAGASTEVLDATLASGEQLYTAGNVLPNTPAPSCRHVNLFQRRLVLSGCGDGSRVHWSKQIDPGYVVEFSSGDPTHQTQVPADQGRVVATEGMDDRLVVFAENGIGLIDGQGPNPSGTQGQYSEFRTIITEVGASWDSPKSVIRGPEGVWFRSPFGIRLVSRSGSLAIGQDGKQVGSEVDSSVSGAVVAISGGAKQQVRFFTGSSRCLVWDYQWRQWTRFTGMASVDAVYADGRYYHLSNYSTTSPLLRYTDNNTHVDVSDSNASNQVISTYLELPWLAMGGLQGFQRIYRIVLLGKNADGSVQPQTIGLSLNYDYQAAYSSDAPFVSVTPTAGGVIQYQHHFVTQKCESIKIAIYFYPTTPGNAGRFRLSDVTLQVGVKQGLFKLPSSQRF